MLHDYEKHEQAADILDPLVKAIQGEGRVGQLYAKLHDYYAGRLSLPENEGAGRPLALFIAPVSTASIRTGSGCARSWNSPSGSIRAMPTCLIAMYRLPEADEKWRESTRQRIANLARQFKQEIDESPSDPTPYNQWAWLISNTEGDFQKAIRYSHRSLELIPAGAANRPAPASSIRSAAATTPPATTRMR